MYLNSRAKLNGESGHARPRLKPEKELSICPGMTDTPVFLADVPETDEFVSRSLDFLFICDNSHPAAAVRDHINSFVSYSKHNFHQLNPILNTSPMGLEDQDFDAILIHYSIYTLGKFFLPPEIEEFIANFQGPKFQFIQDEYRNIADMNAKMKRLGTHVLFSSLEPANIERVYSGQQDLIAYASLPGVVTRDLVDMNVPKIADRKLDSVYRTHDLPYWLGRQARLKSVLVEEFGPIAKNAGLRVDLSNRNEDRIYGEDWTRFICSARSTLGSEGGASIFDFDGVADRARVFLDDYPDADFDTVFEKVLSVYEGNIVHTTITPRIFEAIALRTPLVLLEGRYRDAIVPGQHYISLKHDMSNADDVCQMLQDVDFLQTMANRAFEDVALSDQYSWPHFARQFDRAVDRSLHRLKEKSAATPLLVLPEKNSRSRGASQIVDICRFLNDERYRETQVTSRPRPQESGYLQELYSSERSRDEFAARMNVKEVRRPLRIALLCNIQFKRGASGNLSIDTLEKLSRNNVECINFLTKIPAHVDLNSYDVIVIHWTVILGRNNYIEPALRARIARSNAVKAVFIQDEYRFVDRTKAALLSINADVLFTCVPQSEWEKVYSSEDLPGLTRVQLLTGYVPPGLPTRHTPDVDDRPIDVGYRGRDLPAWLGELAQEKMHIGRRFEEEAPTYGLNTDIRWTEGDRLYGEDWLAFLCRCKAMLGVESGASVFDFTGQIQKRVDDHVKENPDATFEELKELYFAEEEGKIRLNQVSPRIFECVAVHTLLILYEGEYSGILEPWVHYVPLKKDHSNMDEVVAVLRDSQKIKEITDRAYWEIGQNPAYQYDVLAQTFDDVIEATAKQKQEKKPFEAHLLPWKPSLATRFARRSFSAFAAAISGAKGIIVPEFKRYGRVTRTWTLTLSRLFSLPQRCVNFAARKRLALVCWVGEVLLPRLPTLIASIIKPILKSVDAVCILSLIKLRSFVHRVHAKSVWLRWHLITKASYLLENFINGLKFWFRNDSKNSSARQNTRSLVEILRIVNASLRDEAYPFAIVFDMASGTITVKVHVGNVNGRQHAGVKPEEFWQLVGARDKIKVTFDYRDDFELMPSIVTSVIQDGGRFVIETDAEVDGKYVLRFLSRLHQYRKGYLVYYIENAR
ncbi:glycosyltransferase [Aestuariispira ectoiniformans]|uniref:glycosyltransferase n=1 Tax=Aestuariispira ectoiniformans TaxID=2775080 RepID=UPI00223B9EF1|nr:hypothetical protein [Aestuariispira ectoiniformans]